MTSFVLDRLALAVILLWSASARADEQDASALMLADQAPEVAQQAHGLQAFLEAADGGAVQRNDGSSMDNRRLSLDLRYEHALAPDWRAFFADRLDMNWMPAGSGGSINTLKEAYLSWQAQPEALLDAGRINVRNGVAMGYNPTDFFRDGAVRSMVSLSPASIKENRQGSIMLRGQSLWESGALTLLYSPGLYQRSSALDPRVDAGATNVADRWLFTLSQKMGAQLTPQFLLYREAGLSPQFGFNLSGLVDDATVAHLEWSGGRSTAPLVGAPAGSETWRNRLATGLTFTTPNKMSLTAEYHYSGAGLDETAWNALRSGPLPIYGQYRSQIQKAQELPTRQMLFFYATWQDAIINHLDLSIMHNLDLVDSSRRTWLEARYHVGNIEYAVQGQRNDGQKLSNFGALPESRSWQVLMRYYF